MKKVSLIAAWYVSEWNIPLQTTLERTKKLSRENYEFQVLMTLDGRPIATGGLYNHVGLLDKEPRFSIHKHWLALVYTAPDSRGKGLGAFICNYIQEQAKDFGLKDIYLFIYLFIYAYCREFVQAS